MSGILFVSFSSSSPLFFIFSFLYVLEPLRDLVATAARHQIATCALVFPSGRDATRHVWMAATTNTYIDARLPLRLALCQSFLPTLAFASSTVSQQRRCPPSSSATPLSTCRWHQDMEGPLCVQLHTTFTTLSHSPYPPSCHTHHHLALSPYP